MGKGIISVNDARIIADSTGSLTAAVDTSHVYESKYRHMARKREVNVKVISGDSDNYLMRHFPLLDKTDIAEMRGTDQSHKYIHFGSITVSIEPLIHSLFLKNHGKKIMGICAIIDTMFKRFDESIISLHQFDLSQRRADFICMPDHCLSLTDENLLKRVSVLLIFDNLSVEPGCELFNICVGHVTTCTNTLNPTGEKNRIRNIPIRGVEEVNYEQVAGKLLTSLNEVQNGDPMCFMQDGDDSVIMKPRNILEKMKLKRQPKVVLRKNYTASTSDKTHMLRMPKLTRTLSDPRRSTDNKMNMAPLSAEVGPDSKIIGGSTRRFVVTDNDLKRMIREDKEAKLRKFQESKTKLRLVDSSVIDSQGFDESTVQRE
ncbi:TPA_asm: P3 [Triticum alphacytorhabdovirus 1]|nr:TPA_asm: P3 [Triticum alphacytorhabdovirus 1]